MSRQVSRSCSFLCFFPPFVFYCYFVFSILSVFKKKKKREKKRERERTTTQHNHEAKYKNRKWKCCRHGTGSGHTIQSCTSLQCHFIQSHICRVHVLLALTSPLHFWQNDWDLLFLRASAVTRGGMDTKIRVCTESWPWRRKFFHHSGGDSNPCPFNHKSGTELSIKNQVTFVHPL